MALSRRIVAFLHESAYSLYLIAEDVSAPELALFKNSHLEPFGFKHRFSTIE